MPSPEPWTYDGETEKVMSASGDVVASCWGATAAEAHANGRRIAALSAENARLREALRVISADRPKGGEPPQGSEAYYGNYDDCYAGGFDRALWLQADVADAALAAQEAP